MAKETAAPRRIWQLPTFVIGIACVWAAATFITPPLDAAGKLGSKLDDLASALEKQPIPVGEVETLVKTLAETPNQSPRHHYLLGTAYIAMAMTGPTEKTDCWTLALQHFEATEVKTLKPEEQAKLKYKLAMASAATNRGEPTALIAALMNPPANEKNNEVPRLIAMCALRSPKPDLARARDELTRYLGGQNHAGPAADRLKLQLAELHLKLNETEKARRWLKDISPSASNEVLVSAKSILGQQAYDDRNWAEAVAMYESVLALPKLSSTQTNTLRYRLGEAYLRIGRYDKMLDNLTVSSREPGRIGVASSFRLAEYHLQNPASVGKRGEAADWLERGVAMLPPDQIAESDRQVAESMIKTCIAESDFPSAVRATNAYEKIGERAVSAKYTAEINMFWADATAKSEPAAAKAKYLAAANAYVSLAESESTTPKKAAVLHQAMKLFRQAGDAKSAGAIVQTLLTLDALEPDAMGSLWLAKAEMLPVSDYNGVREALEQSMNRPGPASVTARLKLGMLYLQKSQSLLVNAPGSINPEAAKKEADAMGRFGRDLLRQVAETITVTNEERASHEQALFELGRLSLKDAKYTEAETRFKKQLNLYPTGNYSGYGRLWLVCSLLQQAHASDAPKKLFEEALSTVKPLAHSGDPYLRTYGEIWTANTLLELGDAAAAMAYSKDLMAKHRGKAEELVAGKLLFYAYLKLPAPEPAEASRTLDRMEQAFAALPENAYPNDPEYSQSKWKTELPKLRDELRKFTPQP